MARRKSEFRRFSLCNLCWTDSCVFCFQKKSANSLVPSSHSQTMLSSSVPADAMLHSSSAASAAAAAADAAVAVTPRHRTTSTSDSAHTGSAERGGRKRSNSERQPLFGGFDGVNAATPGHQYTPERPVREQFLSAPVCLFSNGIRVVLGYGCARSH